MPSPCRGHAVHRLVTLLAAALAACSPDAPLDPSATEQAALVEGAAAGGNTRSGSITIQLFMRPSAAADVPFTTAGRKIRDFALDDDADPALPNSRTFTGLRPGTYAVQMATTPDGPLTRLLCTSTGGMDNNTVDLGTRTATINLEAGEAVTCRFIDGWEAGDLSVFSQFDFDNNRLIWFTAYNTVYAPSFGVVEVGIPGTAGFSMRFSSAARVQDYLTTFGTPAALTSDLLNPTSSSSGLFGGDVLALQLNVDLWGG